VDYVLDVPMYFVYRDGKYIDASGQSFRDFLEGRLPAYPGKLPTMDDWEAHLTTVFPEVRLKRFLEMRGADNGPWRSICSLPALWVRHRRGWAGILACQLRRLCKRPLHLVRRQVGLLYDDQALAEAVALTSDWTTAERAALRDQARGAYAATRPPTLPLVHAR
jgi:glutamate--cysteine ligase